MNMNYIKNLFVLMKDTTVLQRICIGFSVSSLLVLLNPNLVLQRINITSLGNHTSEISHMVESCAIIMCILLLLFTLTKNSTLHSNKIFMIYWHITLAFILLFIPNLYMLFGYYNDKWIILSSCFIIIFAFLVDWLSFGILYLLNFVLAYSIYVITTGIWSLTYTDHTLFYVIIVYLLRFSLIIPLYQRDKIQSNKEELEKALKIKDDFLDKVSHEIKTPVQGILGISGELYSQWIHLSDKERYELSYLISSNSHRLMSLLSHLLDTSKLMSNRMSSNLVEANISEALFEIKQEYSILCNQKSLTFVMKKNNVDDNLKVICDKEQIKQVLHNLLSNSLKFTEQGQIILEVTYQLAGMLFTITDTGIGVPEKEIKEIFTSFSQSSRSKGRYPGTGLGLTICSEIIASHNGKIWSENTREGAKFCFTINNNLEESQDKTILTYRDSVDYTLSGKNILLIDDEETCRISGKLILSSAGAKVALADGPSEAIKILQQKPKFDLIIVDYMMPTMNGIELIEKIQGYFRLDAPFIIQTGASAIDKLDKGNDLNILGYFLKPYNKAQMINSLQMMMTVYKDTLVNK